jgi:hypothetical protein
MGIHFSSEQEMEDFLSRTADPETKCPVTGMSNLNHKSRYGEALSLDHSHFSGRARGLVHRNVNALIGWLERDEMNAADLVQFLHLWNTGFFKP